MGNQFAEVHLWSSNFKDSKPGRNSKFSGLAYSERITIADQGETIQELDSFDSTTHSLSYHTIKGAPSVGKHANAIWSLSSDEANKTTVVIEFNMEMKEFLGFIMTPFIKKGMGKSATVIADDLKYYVENSKASERKMNK